MKNHTCERCGEILKCLDGAVWMELDTRTGTYTTGDVPEAFSQGAFSFGKACAKRAQTEHDAATGEKQ